MTNKKHKHQAHSFISTRGIHFDFDTQEEAKLFYQDAVTEVHNDFVIERTMVIWWKNSPDKLKNQNEV